MKETLELSPRLEQVAALVPAGVCLADIGTDHAYLPTSLLLRGRSPRAIAADLRPGPLERARATAMRYGCEGRMDFRLCDGLTGIGPEECGCVVIAGMGGETIAHILSAAPWTRREDLPLILQPMSTQRELRAYLTEHGYRIASEHLVREGDTIYVVMLARGGKSPSFTPGELWAGRQGKDPLRAVYLEGLMGKLDRALSGLGRAQDPSQLARREELELIRAELTAMREELET